METLLGGFSTLNTVDNLTSIMPLKQRLFLHLLFVCYTIDSSNHKHPHYIAVWFHFSKWYCASACVTEFIVNVWNHFLYKHMSSHSAAMLLLLHTVRLFPCKPFFIPFSNSFCPNDTVANWTLKLEKVFILVCCWKINERPPTRVTLGCKS